jgi:hypothetical protein
LQYKQFSTYNQTWNSKTVVKKLTIERVVVINIKNGPLKGSRCRQVVVVCVVYLPELRSKFEESWTLFGRLGSGRCSKPEECVELYGTLPQVLAALVVFQAAKELDIC